MVFFLFFFFGFVQVPPIQPPGWRDSTAESIHSENDHDTKEHSFPPAERGRIAWLWTGRKEATVVDAEPQEDEGEDEVEEGDDELFDEEEAAAALAKGLTPLQK